MVSHLRRCITSQFFGKLYVNINLAVNINFLMSHSIKIIYKSLSCEKTYSCLTFVLYQSIFVQFLRLYAMLVMWHKDSFFSQSLQIIMITMITIYQPQDFLHPFPSNIHPDKTYLSTYFIMFGNKSWYSKEYLSLKVWVW